MRQRRTITFGPLRAVVDGRGLLSWSLRLGRRTWRYRRTRRTRHGGARRATSYRRHSRDS